MTPYETLGVPRDATPEAIKAAYRRRVMETHPDRNPDAAKRAEFERVQAAYELLGDPERRAKYDLTGDDGRNDVPSAATIAKRAFTDAMTDDKRKPAFTYLQHAAAILRQKRSNTRRHLQDLEEDIRQLEHTKKHLLRKKGDPVLEEAIDDMLVPRLAELPRLRTWLPRFDDALEILKHYSFAQPAALTDALFTMQ